jgi:glycosyltransferase involved in cell wall biosynthesis
MRIVIVQGAFLPVPTVAGGAVEKMWFRLGQEFAALSHDVTHISRCFRDLPHNEYAGGVRYLRIPGYDQPVSQARLKLLDLLYSWRACKQVSKDSDVIVTNTFWSPIVMPKSLGGRVYVDVQRMPKGQCRFYTRAARLRANSLPVAQAIKRELPLRQHQRVSLIPNSLPFDVPDFTDLDSKQNKIIYCGRLHPEKGLDLLIKAASNLEDGWEIEIIGPWEESQGGGGKLYADSLRRMAQELPISFKGPEFRMDRLSEYYRRSAIFVYPSIAEKGETFGLAPLEAMAWGCVPIVSDLACFRDFVSVGVNGLSFDHRGPDAVSSLAAALRTLMASPEVRHRLALNAMQVRTSHSPRTIAERFLSDFRQIATKC